MAVVQRLSAEFSPKLHITFTFLLSTLDVFAFPAVRSRSVVPSRLEALQSARLFLTDAVHFGYQVVVAVVEGLSADFFLQSCKLLSHDCTLNQLVGVNNPGYTQVAKPICFDIGTSSFP